MNIKITGVHHIMITVGDIGEAKFFYSAILGFEEMEVPDYIANIEKSGYKKRSTCEKYDDGFYRLYIHDPFNNCIEIINATVNA